MGSGSEGLYVRNRPDGAPGINGGEKMIKDYEMVIGLEVHVELKTRTKIFCGCKTDFGAEPNTQYAGDAAGAE